MLLKEVYNQKLISNLASEIAKTESTFDEKKFLFLLSEEKLFNLALKQRMRSITYAIEYSLVNLNYKEKLVILQKVVTNIPKDRYSGLAFIIFPDFVEVFGKNDFEKSMNALEFFTEFGTSEFAVRQFIKIDQKKALSFFTNWSKSKNYHVRRLASEGLRPRLPWGEALPNFKKDPS
ncbi:MAG: hypothetical protein FJ368_04865, partial [Pelagibacterales bacterium]|nr:hypothetical protein [Pelagibacterales bacterium]